MRDIHAEPFDNTVLGASLHRYIALRLFRRWYYIALFIGLVIAFFYASGEQLGPKWLQISILVIFWVSIVVLFVLEEEISVLRNVIRILSKDTSYHPIERAFALAVLRNKNINRFKRPVAAWKKTTK